MIADEERVGREGEGMRELGGREDGREESGKEGREKGK